MSNNKLNKNGSPNKFYLVRQGQIKNIMNATFDLFMDRPFGSVTMKDIALKANISRQTLYKYYDNIEQVLYGLASEVIYEWNDYDLGYVAPEGTTGIEQIRGFVTRSLDYVKENPDSVFFISIFDIYNRKNQKAYPPNEKYDEAIQMRLHRGLSIIEKGLADGSVRQDRDPMFVFSSLLNEVVAFSSRVAVLRDKMLPAGASFDLDTLIEEFINHIVDAYAA